MIGSFLLLAVVAGAGRIPIPESVMRFPRADWWPGDKREQAAGMLAAIASEGGEALRSSGPGPQQLAARWRAGQLNAAERVVVLLVGPTFHDPCLFPILAEGLRSKVLRERQAAAVGLAWLVGEPAPAPYMIPDKPESWEALSRGAERLGRVTRRHTLVRIWIASYLTAMGRSAHWGYRFERTPEQCLVAIREIATPADLPDLLAVWPLLARPGHRYSVVRTLEIITLKVLVRDAPGPRGVTGPWGMEAAVSVVDAWVANTCRPPAGEDVVLDSLRAQGFAGRDGQATARSWLRVMRASAPQLWPLAAERLTGFGAPAIELDREQLDNPGNKEKAKAVRRYFAITDAELGAERKR